MLEIDESHLREIRAHGVAGYPDEVCGILLGSANAAGVRAVRSVRRAGNLDRERSRDRFELDPRDLLRAEIDAKDLGLEVVGVYHSHPDHPARASETDRLRAAAIWGSADSWSYVIVGVEKGAADRVRSWVLRGGAFEEEEIRAPAGG